MPEQILAALGSPAADRLGFLRPLLLLALPLTLLIVSPERLTVSVAAAVAYSGGAVILVKLRKADRWVIAYCLVAATIMALGLARVELWGHSTDPQLTYAATKAIYFIAIVLPIGGAAALLIRDSSDLRPVVWGFLILGIPLGIATILTRNPYLLGESRYTWQGNLIAVAVLLLLQGWLVRPYLLALALALMGLLASLVITSRQSLVAIAVAIVASIAVWFAAERTNSAKASFRRLWLLPLGLAAAWASLIFALLFVSALRRVDFPVPAYVPDSLTCHCGLSHVNELIMGTGHGDANRVMLLQYGQVLLQQHPLVGAGLGAYVGYLPVDEYPHNVALELASELGVPAALVILLPLIVGTALLIRRAVVEASQPLTSLLMIVIVFGVVASFSGDVAGNRVFWVFALAALKLGLDPPLRAPNPNR